MTKTFIGGAHPQGSKEDTKAKKIRRARLPKKVIIPMSQHTGAPCIPKVKVGDIVKTGQLIGDCDKFISSPVHSSITGKVTSIDRYPHPVFGEHTAIMIEGDGISDEFAYKGANDNLKDISNEQLLNRIRQAGIVGLGGAMFPTHVKLSPPPNKPVDTLIINGAECEPFLSCDHRLMIERPKDILKGLDVIMQILGVQTAYIGIESNKMDAVAALRNAMTEIYNIHRTRNSKRSIKIAVLKVKYPQGSEKQLLKAVMDREIPQGGLPFDVGCIVQNIGTVLAVKEAVIDNKPLYERVVTVCGSPVKEPSNLLVRIGTLVSSIVEECGGLEAKVGKIIFGGPMMGIAQYTDEVPVIKGTSGILLMTEAQSTAPQWGPCIRCGKCLEVCPSTISPATVGIAAEKEMFNMAKENDVMDCIECGLCSYVCPLKRPLLHFMKTAKAEIIKKRAV